MHYIIGGKSEVSNSSDFFKNKIKMLPCHNKYKTV